VQESQAKLSGCAATHIQAWNGPAAFEAMLPLRVGHDAEQKPSSGTRCRSDGAEVSAALTRRMAAAGCALLYEEFDSLSCACPGREIPLLSSVLVMARSVRRAVAGDAQAIAEVQVMGWQAAYRGLVPDAFLDTFTLEARTARWIELLEQSSETYVTDGGFCSIIRPARDGSAPVELAALYVAPSRWRHGIGRMLLDTALARDADVTLWVFAQNNRARGFYTALGFTDDDAQAVDPETGVLEIRLRRPATTDSHRTN